MNENIEFFRIARFPNSEVFDLTPRWKDEFPAAVEVSVEIFWKPELLSIGFKVREPQIRALEIDPGLVHRDSCVEFFFLIPGSRKYLNIEVNPVGVLLMASGEGRGNRLNMTETLKMIPA